MELRDFLMMAGLIIGPLSVIFTVKAELGFHKSRLDKVDKTFESLPCLKPRCED